ncbi:hypothetical protein ACQ4PT_066094 [Festuca glaucescens]
MASIGSDGAQQTQGELQLSSSSSTSNSSRDSDMASKLQKATSLTIRVLQEITDDFSEERKIGQGAYGKVYVAKLENGEDIAVKMLYNNTPGIDDVQFQREFQNLMRLEHHNIVKLVGYCYETQHQPMQYMGKTIFAERTYRALCFDYMQNGSLQKHITAECDGLDWRTRYKIIKGTCEGLKHLHEGFEEPIYHLDLKPDNILLDKNMVPKLADFGLSKLFGDQQTMTTQTPIGTIGYLPMEFLHGNIVSNKFDIFSLGVVMIKIIAGHEAYSRSVEMHRGDFLDLVNANWRDRMHKTCRASRPLDAYCEQVNVCTEIALSCMEIDRHKRPSIEDIINQLNDTEAMIDKALSWSASSHSRMNEDLVNFRAVTGSEAILYAEKSSKFPVLVRVTAPPWHHAEEIPRAGVDLVVVLGKNWLSAYYLPKAMMIVIDNLGPNDRLSIVLFDSDAHRLMELTYMSDRGQADARLKINELVDGRATNIGDGLQEGAQILRGRELEEGDSRVGCIMLLTDSNDMSILGQEISTEYPVHTFGVDNHDPEAMKYIADKTFGTYSFVKWDAEDVRDAFGLFINGITKVVATSVKITLRAHEGVAISSIESGCYINRVNSDEMSGEIEIKDIYAGEQKNFIIYLAVKEGNKKLVTIDGGYQSIHGIKRLADMDVFVLRPRSGCSPAKLVMHRGVAAELVRLQLVKELSILVARGQRLTFYNMDQLWDTVRLSEDSRNADEETLSRLGKCVAEIRKVACLPDLNPKQVPYLMSWLSCHQWQRATTKGLLYESGAFTLAQPGVSDADGEDNE